MRVDDVQEILHVFQRALQPKKRETVRLEEVSVPSPSLPGSHEAIDHVSRWDTEGLGNPTRYWGWGCREWSCDWRLRETWRECGEHGIAETGWYCIRTLKCFTSTLTMFRGIDIANMNWGCLFCMEFA
jgi:hypothetical protein